MCSKAVQDNFEILVKNEGKFIARNARETQIEWETVAAYDSHP